MQALKYTAPLIVATLLLAIFLIPFLSQARTTDRCTDSDRGTSRSTTTCEVTEPVDDTTPDTNEPGDTTATSTDPTNDEDDTATTTPPTNNDTTSTSSDDGTEENTEDNTSGGGGSGGDDTETAKISIRNESGIAVAANESFTPGEKVMITPTDGNPAVEVNSASALALLVSLDERSSEFSITDLQYYPSFGAFFLNCIKVSGKNLCGEWQYTINGNYPSVGLDQYVVSPNDSVFLFFGSPRTVEVATEVTVGTNFTATAYEYDPEDDKYFPLSGYTIGVIQDNPDNPWSPNEIATQKTDKSGKATFSIDTIGTYKIGLKEDYYSPSTEFSVVASVSTGGGGGSSNSASTDEAIDTQAAVAFLLAHQSADGSFGAPLYTDWAAIALAAAGTNEAALANVRAYLKTANGNFKLITDHERRAMALMAAGLNPRTDTGTDHIAAIIDSFDGTQVGLENEVNDDIFALLVLMKAGYGPEEEIITKLSERIANMQNSDGSWGSSPDMTAAGIIALTPLTTDIALTARAKARAHLKAAQKDDGGFGNTFSTSWVLMAISALGETPEQWIKNGTSPLNALAAAQQSDGGFDEMSQPDSNRLWATTYALPAALGTSWLLILDPTAAPTVMGATDTTPDVAIPSTEVTLTTTRYTAPAGTVNNTPATPTRTNVAFRFLSDGDVAASNEDGSMEISVSAKETGSKASGEMIPNTTKEERSFFSRLFSKIGSVLFFWR